MSSRTSKETHLQPLDIFILAVIGRLKATTLYALQQQADLSPGTASPSLRRLLALGFIRKGEARGEKQAKKLTLTNDGECFLEANWRDLLLDVPDDAESILRRAWVAYPFSNDEALTYLRTAAQELEGRSRELQRAIRRGQRDEVHGNRKPSYSDLRAYQEFHFQLAQARLAAECDALRAIAQRLQDSISKPLGMEEQQ